jgi:hypothetical protein
MGSCFGLEADSRCISINLCFVAWSWVRSHSASLRHSFGTTFPRHVTHLDKSGTRTNAETSISGATGLSGMRTLDQPSLSLLRMASQIRSRTNFRICESGTVSSHSTGEFSYVVNRQQSGRVQHQMNWSVPRFLQSQDIASAYRRVGSFQYIPFLGSYGIGRSSTGNPTG